MTKLFLLLLITLSLGANNAWFCCDESIPSVCGNGEKPNEVASYCCADGSIATDHFHTCFKQRRLQAAFGDVSRRFMQWQSSSPSSFGNAGSHSKGSWTSAGPVGASLGGDVGFTTVSGYNSGSEKSGTDFSPGENIYGPFEFGFTSTQGFILSGLGCNPSSDGYLEGGIDTHYAEQMMATQCNIELPRWEGNQYLSLIDQCGGHTPEYHFHERFSCLYDATTPGHSTQVAQMMDAQFLYGKFEDQATGEIPLLDACGGHFGVTPDSNGESVYHYHVQVNPPFTVGCFGPNADGTLVTVEQCRAAYSTCGDSDVKTFSSNMHGEFEYDLWCPCYDADASNVNSRPLPVFSGQDLPVAVPNFVLLNIAYVDRGEGFCRGVSQQDGYTGYCWKAGVSRPDDCYALCIESDCAAFHIAYGGCTVVSSTNTKPQICDTDSGFSTYFGDGNIDGTVTEFVGNGGTDAQCYEKIAVSSNTPAPTVAITPSPTVAVTPSPTVAITPAPTVAITPAPTRVITPSPTIATPDVISPAPTSPSTSWVSTSRLALGCWKDTWDRFFVKKIIGLQLHGCHTACLALGNEYAYMAYQNGNECFCGLKTEDYRVNGEHTTCNSGLGGPWGGSVYQIRSDAPITEKSSHMTGRDVDVDHVVTVSSAPTSASPTAGWTANGRIALGCWRDTQDRFFDQRITITGLQLDSCQTECLASGEYAYMAYQNGNECYCGLKTEDYRINGEHTSCNSGLGGAWGGSVYQISSDAPITVKSSHMTGSDFVSTVSNSDWGRVSLGCWLDNWDRVFDRKVATIGLSLNGCEHACLALGNEYAYMGYENGNECFCGSLSDDYRIAGMHTTCTAGMGGNWGLSVYQIRAEAPITESSTHNTGFNTRN